MTAQSSPWRDTLAEAQARVQEVLDTGEMIDCPCCGQTVKRYSRQLHRTVILGLWAIARSGREGLLPHEIMGQLARRGFHISGNDHCKLMYWGLATKGSTDETVEQRWRCTPKGHAFLNGRTLVPKYAYVFNGDVTGFSVEQVSIRDIATKFDLDDLLNPDNLWR